MQLIFHLICPYLRFSRVDLHNCSHAADLPKCQLLSKSLSYLICIFSRTTSYSGYGQLLTLSGYSVMLGLSCAGGLVANMQCAADLVVLLMQLPVYAPYGYQIGLNRINILVSGRPTVLETLEVGSELVYTALCLRCHMLPPGCH